MVCFFWICGSFQICEIQLAPDLSNRFMFLEYPVDCGLVSQVRFDTRKICCHIVHPAKNLNYQLCLNNVSFKAHSDRFISICVLTLGVLSKILCFMVIIN